MRRVRHAFPYTCTIMCLHIRSLYPRMTVYTYACLHVHNHEWTGN